MPAIFATSSYRYFYEKASQTSSMNEGWMRDLFGQKVARKHADKAILSSGIFAMAAENPIWTMWRDELCALMGKKLKRGSIHIAEQTALNYIAFSTGNFVPLPALHNYNCPMGPVRRTTEGSVVVDLPPYQKIGVVHLTAVPWHINDYLSRGLLFQSGEYLTDLEINRLKSAAHYG